MITLNAAWIVGVDDRVGSIDVGKDADLVIWDGYPLSSYGTPEKVFIDGQVFFDRMQAGYGLTQYAGTPEGDSAPPVPAAVPAMEVRR
jgi:urease alpha subunit